MFRFFKKKDDDVIKAPIISKRGTQNGIVVKDIFDIKGQGIYVTGTAEGMIRNGDQAVIIRSDETMIKTTIAQIDVNHKTVEQAVEGEECGLKLSGITSKSDLNVGDRIDIVLDQPGNISGVGGLIHLLAHLLHIEVVFLIRLFRRDANLVEGQVGEVEGKPFIRLFREVLGTVDSEVFLDEVHLADVLHIVADDLGIVGDHRAVVVVVAEILIKVI